MTSFDYLFKGLISKYNHFCGTESRTSTYKFGRGHNAAHNTRFSPASPRPAFTCVYSRELQKNIHFRFIDYARAFDCVHHNKLWKILKEMEIPEHLTCLLRNLYAGQEATTRTGHGTTVWFQIGKGVC